MQLNREFTLSIDNLFLWHFTSFSKTMLLYHAFRIADCLKEEKAKVLLLSLRPQAICDTCPPCLLCRLSESPSKFPVNLSMRSKSPAL